MSDDSPCDAPVQRARILLLTPLTLPKTLETELSAEGVLERASIDDVGVDDLEHVEVVVLRSGPQLLRPQISRLPALRHVVRPGSGLDNVDQEALAERGVVLHRDGATGAAAVAELVALGLGVLTRQMLRGHLLAARGRWSKSELVGEPVAGLAVCVWGAGPVGRAAAVALRERGCDVRFVEHRSLDADDPVWSRAQAMAEADVHVMALPLRASTRHTVDRAWLEEASVRRPYLVNMGRWDLLDVDATLAALSAGGLRGVHIDPLDPGNLADLDLTSDEGGVPNLLVTQHQGAQRSDVRHTLDEWAARVVLDGLGA